MLAAAGIVFFPPFVARRLQDLVRMCGLCATEIAKDFNRFLEAEQQELET